MLLPAGGLRDLLRGFEHREAKKMKGLRAHHIFTRLCYPVQVGKAFLFPLPDFESKRRSKKHAQKPGCAQHWRSCEAPFSSGFPCHQAAWKLSFKQGNAESCMRSGIRHSHACPEPLQL